MISLFGMPSKYSTEVLFSGPKCKKVVMCLIEKRHVIDELPSGMSYSEVGCECNVNESTIYTK